MQFLSKKYQPLILYSYLFEKNAGFLNNIFVLLAGSGNTQTGD